MTSALKITSTTRTIIQMTSTVWIPYPSIMMCTERGTQRQTKWIIREKHLGNTKRDNLQGDTYEYSN